MKSIALAGAIILLAPGAFAQFVNTNPGNFGYQPIPSYQPSYQPPSYLPPSQPLLGPSFTQVPPPAPSFAPTPGCFYRAAGC